MSEAKPFASLSSGLLARKGAAKPAMRPQGFGSFGGNLEDLGWNDMGNPAQAEPQMQPLPEHVPSSIAALTPIGGRSESPPSEDASPPPPPVVEQQRAIAERLNDAPPVRAAPAPVPTPVPAPRPKGEVVALPPRQRTAGKAKAAFTLRLDPDRHLKLRLACAVAGRSAQQIVTEALDTYLADRPELESLANQLPTARKG